MSGRLTVESREGLGTRFAVVLPLAEAARLRGVQDEHGGNEGVQHGAQEVA
jgi:hypothetical protein